MAVEIRLSVAKNRMYVRMEGFITDEEAKKAADKCIQEVAKLSPGFAIITDITTFKPGSPNAAAEIMRCQKVYKERGVKHLIRIVGENVLAKMQLQRTGQETGVEAAFVRSLEEAERMLDGK